MLDFFKILEDVGFPIASAIAAGYFVFLSLKYILIGVTSSIKNMNAIICSLDARVKVMNADMIRIDTLVSSSLGLKPDLERIARAKGADDSRHD